MVAVADAQKAAERHHSNRRPCQRLFDHHRMDGAELLPLPIVNCCTINFVRGDQLVVSSVATALLSCIAISGPRVSLSAPKCGVLKGQRAYADAAVPSIGSVVFYQHVRGYAPDGQSAGRRHFARARTIRVDPHRRPKRPVGGLR
jgi:hypothetical protein